MLNIAFINPTSITLTILMSILIVSAISCPWSKVVDEIESHSCRHIETNKATICGKCAGSIVTCANCGMTVGGSCVHINFNGKQ